MINKEKLTDFENNLLHKTVVTDTSSLLTSGTSLLNVLPSCTIVIPSIVIRELEDKRSHATLGFQAREWLRLIEDLRKEFKNEVKEGIKIPSHKGITLIIEPNHTNRKNIPLHIQDMGNDSTILSVAFNLKSENVEVVLLSNDTPMRIHATLDLDIDSYEYNTTLAVGSKPFDGKKTIYITDEEYTNTLELGKKSESFKLLVEEKLGKCSEANFYVEVMLENSRKVVGNYLYNNGVLDGVNRKRVASGITSRTIEQDVAYSYLYADADDKPIVSISGSAGTGKTLLSVSVGLEELKKGNYQRLIVLRSLHEMGAGQELGFLPGTVDEKMEAWAGAVYDALDVIASNKFAGPRVQNNQKIKEEVKFMRSLVEVSPITYLRGRSLSNSFIILDEAQNFSRNELLNILTRAGEGTKMILLFDSNQVDNRFLQSGSKSDIWSVVDDLKSNKLFAHIGLQKSERSMVAELTSKLLEK